MEKITVLLVEDEQTLAMIIKDTLEGQNFIIHTAADGEEGLRKFFDLRPDVLVADVMMPRMDGLETCRRLREHDELKDTMIVFLSALGEEEQQLAGFGVGADDYLTKPIKMKLLVSRVQAILKRIDADDTPAAPDSAQTGITVDRERHTVLCDGREITLPRKEFALLELLQFSLPAVLRGF